MTAQPIRQPVLDTGRPFSRADARAAGLPLTTLLSSEFQRVFRDRYVAANVPITLLLRAQTALGIASAGSWISHHTAARLLGGAVPDVPDIHVTVPDGLSRTRCDGIRSHRGARTAGCTTYRGLRMSTPVQVFCELSAYGLDLVDLVVLGDSLVKACRVGRAELVDATAAWTGPGARRARRAARLVRDGVDSPMETRLRLLLVLAGLPEPTVNLILRSADGEWRMRFDLCYEHLRLIVEYDGRHHAESADQWRRDLRRREELDRLGWRILVVTAQDIYSAPRDVLERVSQALLERGVRTSRLRLEWERYFARAT